MRKVEVIPVTLGEHRLIHRFKVSSGHGYRTVTHVYKSQERAIAALQLLGGEVECCVVKEIYR